jgi:hypothetical protein
MLYRWYCARIGEPYVTTAGRQRIIEIFQCDKCPRFSPKDCCGPISGPEYVRMRIDGTLPLPEPIPEPEPEPKSEA